MVKVHLYKDHCEMKVIGISYSKNLFVDGERRLIISFWQWDIEFTW